MIIEYKTTEEAADDLIGNEITGVSKNSQQNNSESVTNENDQEILKEISKERYMFPEESKKIIDNLDINIIL